MERIIAICGLVCNDCPVFIATHENDDNKRKRVSEAWSLALQEHFKPDDINCEGCLDGEKLFKYCSTCVVRECGLKKDVENCAYCTGYPCEKIEKLWRGFKTVSGEEAKANLDEIGKALRNLDEIRKSLRMRFWFPTFQ